MKGTTWLLISCFFCILESGAQTGTKKPDPCEDISLYLEDFTYKDSINIENCMNARRITVVVNNGFCGRDPEHEVKYMVESATYTIKGKTHQATDKDRSRIPFSATLDIEQLMEGEKFSIKAVIGYYKDGLVVKKIPLKRVIHIRKFRLRNGKYE